MVMLVTRAEHLAAAPYSHPNARICRRVGRANCYRLEHDRRHASVSHVDVQQPTNRRDARHARFHDAFVVQD
jgi:hypothetical protein